MLPKTYISDFLEVDYEAIPLVGQKALDFSIIRKSGLSIPSGFIINTKAYFDFFRENNLQTKIQHLLGSLGEDPESLEKTVPKIKKLIREGLMSEKLVAEIFQAYSVLSDILKDAPITIFPSLLNTAGNEEKPTYTHGEANLLIQIKEIWANQFNSQTLSEENNFLSATAIVVERTPETSLNCILLTSLPGDKSKIQLTITVKNNSEILELDKQNILNSQSKLLDNETLGKIVDIAHKIEKQMHDPQDVYLSIEKEKINITYINPITQTEKNTSLYSSSHTATKVFVMLSKPELAHEVAKRQVDGVGLLQGDLVMKDLGVHPKHMTREGKRQEYVEKLADSLASFCHAFSPRPVIYRASDLLTHEYKQLTGGDGFEQIEKNPALGFHGAFRHTQDPEIFQMELDAIKYVRNNLELKNLWLMIPFVRTVRELQEVKKIINDAGMYRSPSFKIWLTIEVPATVILLDKFIETGIDGISIDINNLTMLTLGIDRDNNEVAIAGNEENEAAIWSFERAIKLAHRYQIPSSICGKDLLQHPKLLEKLVHWGISSVTIPHETINQTRDYIAEIEKKLME